MPRTRSPNRDRAFEIYKEHGGKIENRRIAELLEISEKTVGGWKCKDAWELKLNGVLHKDKRSTPKSRGGQPGNKNAVGHGGTGPPGNHNAEKHGLFRKYLPAETFSIIEQMPKDPLDLLWDQIQIAYAAIIRAQQIMYVRDREDSTSTKIGESSGETSRSEKREVQHAWDKQGNFLKSQARAQSELRSLIKQYDEMLHRNRDLATKEQRARIDLLKAQTDKISNESQADQKAESVVIINDIPKPDTG